MSESTLDVSDLLSYSTKDINIKAFVDKQLESVLARRRGLTEEQRVLKRRVEFGAFFSAGDCCQPTKTRSTL